MAERGLVGIGLQLTDEQKRLLRQISDEDFTELIFAAVAAQETVESEEANVQDPRLVNVLYETHQDLAGRLGGVSGFQLLASTEDILATAMAW
jgi:hypothetical protein